jgi:Ca2+-binding RTX toxin-like protein
LSLGTNPSNGTVQINNNGTASILSDDFLTYIPNNGFSGTDSFNYTINDGNGGTATATVTVAVGKTQDGTNKDDLLDGTSGNDIFRGDNGQDTLNGFAGDDLLDGGNGKDTLNGGVGNDTLLGGNGEDVLVGGDGNDLLIGGNSPDTLTGGIGSDIFAIAKNGGNDTITDFSLGQGDRIGLSEGLTFGELAFQGNNILRGTEVLATLTGFDTTALTQANFVTV